MQLSDWKGASLPQRVVLDGLYARLEPLNTTQHARSLFEAATAEGADDRFRYLFDHPPVGFDEFCHWTDTASTRNDPLFFATIDKSTGRAEGRQALMRIDAVNGVIEVGSILWGPSMARTRMATETIFLLANYVFGLGYRRFEWKCNAQNFPSKRAAERFGFQFEGVFRQHMVVKGENRDTAWFSIIDSEWPQLRGGYERWLQPENFDDAGKQLKKLTLRQPSTGGL